MGPGFYLHPGFATMYAAFTTTMFLLLFATAGVAARAQQGSFVLENQQVDRDRDALAGVAGVTSSAE